MHLTMMIYQHSDDQSAQLCDIHLELALYQLQEDVQQLYLKDLHFPDREVRRQNMVHLIPNSTESGHQTLHARYQLCLQ